MPRGRKCGRIRKNVSTSTHSSAPEEGAQQTPTIGDVGSAPTAGNISGRWLSKRAYHQYVKQCIHYYDH